MPINLSIKNFEIFGTDHKELKGIIKEIFTENSYYFETTKKNPTIVDVGAHVGVATLYFKYYFPQANILAIEPHPKAFSLLEKNISENRIENVTAIEAALGITNQEQTIYVDAEDTWLSTTSSTNGAWDESQETYPIEVEGITLDEVVMLSQKMYNADLIDLLKIDIEGAEIELLFANALALKKVDQCIVEFHPTRENGLKLKDFLTFMNKHGFILKSEIKTSPRKRNVLQLIHFVRK